MKNQLKIYSFQFTNSSSNTIKPIYFIRNFREQRITQQILNQLIITQLCPQQQLDMKSGFILIKVLFLGLLTIHVSATIGIDISPILTFQTTFDCLRDGGYKFANVRAFTLEGADLDLSVKDTLLYAQRSGLKTDLFVRPCRGKNAKFQIDEVMLAIAYQYFDKFWLYLEDNPNVGCKWGTNYKSNCDYVQEMVATVKHLNKQPGIYSSPQFWTKTFGSISACPELSSLPLIYHHEDKNAGFDDFKAFGGWSSPYGKVFQGNVTACGITLNKVYQVLSSDNLQTQ